MAHIHPSGDYYVPHGTKWPIIGSIGLATAAAGFSSYLNGSNAGFTVMFGGLLIITYMMYRWFGQVIQESEDGYYNDQVDVSFRMGMGWFIFSEVMFFAAFFGALFYARALSLPWLLGEGDGLLTNIHLWPLFDEGWPSNGPADFGGDFQTIPAWGLPALNTLILLASGVTVTLAHWALKGDSRQGLILWLAATVILGYVFVYLQATEYTHAYNELNLTMESGIYGSTFFMLTGFHGFHVTMGATMLLVILVRAIKGHFTREKHFAFEGVAWYWHFVDVVWLGLFIFVYWI